MRKKVKFIFSIMALFLIAISFGVKVSAAETRHTSSLEMAPLTVHTGNPYQYYQTNYKITLHPTDFYNHNRCEMYIDLYRKDLIGKTFLAGDYEVLGALYSDYTAYRGNHPACQAFYYYETEFGGIVANPVYLYSYD